MNRIEIKEAAKAKIKGNIWNILWPALLIGVLQSVVNNLLTGGPAAVNYNINSLEDLSASVSTSPVSLLVTLVFSVISAAYIKYIINFVRTGNFDANDILNCLKEKWLNILAVVFLEYIIVAIGLALFIIPGIILALGLSMAQFLVIDTDLGPIDCLKKSWEMMKGYKGNLFVFFLSFIGWILLTPFTLGLLFIWLIPYMTVAEVLYYERLKDVNK